LHGVHLVGFQIDLEIKKLLEQPKLFAALEDPPGFCSALVEVAGDQQPASAQRENEARRERLPAVQRIGGTVVVTCPSTAHEVVLDIRPDAPAVFDLGPPGFMLHHWDAAAGLRSHVVLIGDHAGPYFFNAAKNKAAGLV
jgi:hypothetical protein